VIHIFFGLFIIVRIHKNLLISVDLFFLCRRDSGQKKMVERSLEDEQFIFANKEGFVTELTIEIGEFVDTVFKCMEMVDLGLIEMDKPVQISSTAWSFSVKEDEHFLLQMAPSAHDLYCNLVLSHFGGINDGQLVGMIPGYCRDKDSPHMIYLRWKHEELPSADLVEKACASITTTHKPRTEKQRVQLCCQGQCLLHFAREAALYICKFIQ